MLAKQLWKSFNARTISTRLLKHGENKMPLSLIPTRSYAKSNAELDLELNKPLKYTTSPASDWKASHSRIGSKAEFGPWYEPHLVIFSLVGFMVYFFILREENDIDLMLEKPLSDTVKGVK